jgi:hypothetical protein
MKFKLVTVFVVFVALLWSCESDSIPGFKKYHNEDYNFSIYYPYKWDVYEKPGSENSLVMFVSKAESNVDQHLENIHVFIEKFDSVITIEDFYENSLSNIPNLVIDFIKLKSGNTIINGQKSKWIYFSYITGNKQAHNLAYLFVRDTVGYVVSCTGEPERFEEFRPTFEKAGSTFRFE